MAEKYKLSEGSLMDIMKGSMISDCIMQVLGSKKISSNSEKERYRLLLSDGKYVISYAMLSTQSGDGDSIAEIPTYSVIKIKKYVTSVINNTGKNDRRVLVILELDILVSGSEVGVKLGHPDPLPDDKCALTPSGSTLTTQSSINTPRVTTSGNDIAKKSPYVPIQSGSDAPDAQLILPISSLSPYQNKWVIRAKVQLKSPMRTWSNSRGEGKLFSFDVVDESGEIRVTAFREVADKYYDIIEVDKVYYLSKAIIKIANRQFSTLKNDFEMTLHNDSVIQECHDDVSSIPTTKYDFVPIDKLSQVEPGAIVDVIGVCKEASDIVTFQAKSTGRELKKRTIVLVDKSLTSIELTLWGTQAEEFDGMSQPVIVLKGAKVGEFGGGKNLSVMQSTLFKVNPDMPAAHQLKGWYDNDGVKSNTTNISNRTGGNYTTKWLTLADVSENGIENAEQGDYYTCVAKILLIKADNCVYRACPAESCNKKVVDLQNGMYRCEKCNREYPNFKFRLLTSIHLADWGSSLWANVFANEAEQILGVTSEEIGNMDKDETARVVQRSHFKTYQFRLRSKVEVYNDEMRLKTVIVKVEPVNYEQYNRFMVSQLDAIN